MDKLICFALGLITGTSICVALTNNERPTAFPRYSNNLNEQSNEQKVAAEENVAKQEAEKQEEDEKQNIAQDINNK